MITLNCWKATLPDRSFAPVGSTFESDRVGSRFFHRIRLVGSGRIEFFLQLSLHSFGDHSLHGRGSGRVVSDRRKSDQNRTIIRLQQICRYLLQTNDRSVLVRFSAVRIGSRRANHGSGPDPTRSIGGTRSNQNTALPMLNLVQKWILPFCLEMVSGP